MSRRILITGGAGFIGSHLADALLDRNFSVRILDNLCEQVHGVNRSRPDYLNREVELIVGDVSDPDMVRRALQGVDAVYHFAAKVGVGQSMYEVQAYTDVNNVGTAVLVEALIRHPVERLIVASSMSVYGEGLYGAADGTLLESVDRSIEQLRNKLWEPRDADGAPLAPLATPEWKRAHLASVYALSKYDQEQLCLMLGRAYQIPAVALRFFNVYGTRQALGNPYTGVLAIFGARLLNGKRPLVFEDGAQMRDFVSVHDVVRACVLALDEPMVAGHVFNIGSGQARSVREIAIELATATGRPDLEPEITCKYRTGDIRHCFADIAYAREKLGYTPSVSLDEGLHELSSWLTSQVADDSTEQANAALVARGLAV